MNCKTIVFAIIGIIAGTSSFAQSHVGGGDSCRDEIDRIRQNIKGWIERDEAKDLKLEAGWTYNTPGAIHNYKEAMLEVLQDRKVTVTCYLDPALIHDPESRALAEKESLTFKSITIHGTPTDCTNDITPSGEMVIECNYSRVLDPTVAGDRNFRRTHHEFASLAGVELKDGSTFSDYFVSDQVAQYAKPETVWMLGPKKRDGSLHEEVSQYLELLLSLKNRVFEPSIEDLQKFADFRELPFTGVDKMILRGGKLSAILEGVIPGGGAYFNFKYKAHEYGYGNDLCAETDAFSVGFAGVDYGILADLGKIDIRKVDIATHPVAKILYGYNSMNGEKEPAWRKEYNTLESEAGLEIQGLHFHNRIYYSDEPVPGNTYLVRSIIEGKQDTLTVFQVVSFDRVNQVVTIVWRTLSSFGVPHLAR